LDPEYGFRDIVYVNEGGYAMVEDDIILMRVSKRPSKTSKVPKAMILLKLGGHRWPRGIVPFTIAPSLPYKNQLAILNAMEVWQKVTNIKFVALPNADQTEFSDFLLFMPTDNLKCSSSVGRQGGPQIVLLGPNCATMNVAHELGHALGLWHEQSRNDRDQYIRILWENIDENYRYNFNQHLNDGKDFGNYDYQSIMHYTAYNFSINGQPTIVPIREGAMIGQREHLSPKDIAAVNAMYP